jgi:hypothetical protein
MCELYSYRKVCLDIITTQLVYNSYVLFDEASPCLLEDVYEVLILCYWRLLKVKHCRCFTGCPPRGIPEVINLGEETPRSGT